MKTLFRWFAVIVILAFCLGCSRKKSEAVRPHNVPADAVLVIGPKVGWWQQCTPSTSGQPVHCRIWNGGGFVLEDESFLPYDGGPTPTVDELKIEPNPSFAGPDRIFLTNNRVLLPESRFEELKKFVDWSKGKSENPR